MYINFEEYSAFGYANIPEAQFNRFEHRAEALVRKYTFNRITDENISEMNKYGICEIMDVFFMHEQASADGQLSSFSNEGYSESYSIPNADLVFVESKALGFLDQYFTEDQLYRGV